MKPWKPLKPGYLPREAYDPARLVACGMTPEQADDMVASMRQETIWMNDLYQVNVRDAVVGEGWPAMVHLSIKRRDKKALRDWRHVQLIKNQLVGEENEGVELFPAQSRLTDSANQYHLWVLKDPAARFPFGWATRFVAGPGDDGGSGVIIPNVKQRPFPVIEKVDTSI